MSALDQPALRKALAKDTVKTIDALKVSCNDDAKMQTLARIARHLPPLVEQQTLLSEARSELGRSIGTARKRGEDVQPLMQRSKDISAKLGTLKDQISPFIDELLAIHQAITSSSGGDAKVRKVPKYKADQGPGQFRPLPVSDEPGITDVTVSNTDDAHRWDRYVANNASATHYHQYEWRGVIERNFSQTCGYFAALDSDGKTVGVTASVHMNSRIFGTFMLSMPFLIYGGPIANNQQVNNVLATHVAAFADQNNCTHTELRETHPREGWHEKNEKVAMVLSLPESADGLNNNLGSKLLAQVRRASREQPEFTLGGSELIPEFYSVFSRKMRDLGTPVYAMQFFQDMARTFPGSTHVAVVRLQGKPVAAAFLISFRDTLEIPWAASVRKFDRLGMNMFMYHSLLHHAVANSFRYFDFGRSTRGESTWSFKKQWGAEERQLHWHFMAQGAPFNPGLGQMNAKFALAVAVWKRLPLWVTNRIGPMIARQLPW